MGAAGKILSRTIYLKKVKVKRIGIRLAMRLKLALTTVTIRKLCYYQFWVCS